MDTADSTGLSAEDRYSFLAYYLLRQNQSLQSEAFKASMFAPSPVCLVMDDGSVQASVIERLRT